MSTLRNRNEAFKPVKSLILNALAWLVGTPLLFACFTNGHALPGSNALTLVEMLDSMAMSQPAHPFFAALASLLPSAYALNLFSGLLAGAILALAFALIALTTAKIVALTDNYQERYGFAFATANLTAALTFVQLPWWIAGTHLTGGQWEAFCVLLFMATILFIAESKGRTWKLALGALICAPLIVESLPCLFLVPVAYIFFALMRMAYDEMRWAHLNIWSLFLGIFLIGALIVQGKLMGGESFIEYWELFLLSMRDNVRNLGNWLPHAWLLHLLIVIGWGSVAIAAGSFAMSAYRKWNLLFVLLTLVLALAIVSFFTPVTLSHLWATKTEQPILSALFLAMGAAFLCCGIANQARTEKLAIELTKEQLERQSKISIISRFFARYLLLPALGVVIVASAGLTIYRFLKIDDALLDDYADDIVSRLEQRTFFLGSPWLDPHLALAAQRANKELHLMTPYLYNDTIAINAMTKTLNTSTALDGSDRQRATRMLQLNYLFFISDFFIIQPSIKKIAATLDMADIWYTKPDAAPLPKGLFFGGAEAFSKLTDEQVKALVADQKTLFDKWHQRLSGGFDDTPSWDPMRTNRVIAARHCSLINNNLGAYLADTQRDELAFDSYKRAIDLYPENVSTLFNLYDIVIARGQHKEYETTISKRFRAFLTEHQKRGVRFDLSVMGRVFGTIRNNQIFSQMGFNWAYKTAPESVLAGLRAAQSSLAQSDPQRDAVSAVLSSIYERRGDFEKSEEGYRKAFAADPKNVFALQGALRLALKRGDTDSYKKLLDRAQSHGIEEADLYIFWATYYLRTLDFKNAQQAIANYLVKNPTDCSALVMLGTTQIALKQTDQVERYTMKKLLQVAKGEDFYFVHLLRGHLALSSNKTPGIKRAIENYRMAFDIKPNSVELLETIIRLEFTVQNADPVESDALRLLSLDPNNAFANSIVGAKRLSDGDAKIALLYLRKAATIPNPDVILLNNYADALIYQGDYTEAVKQAQRGIKVNPDFFASYGTLAMAYAKIGQVSPAQKALDKARSLPNGNHPMFFLVDAEIACQRNDSAMARNSLTRIDLEKDFTPTVLEKQAIDAMRTRVDQLKD